MRCTYQPDRRALFTITAKIAVSAKKVPEIADICKAKTTTAEPMDNTSNSGRVINSYFINDIRLTYTVKPQGMREISISLLTNNIFDIKYSNNGYSYGFISSGIESRQNYYYPQAGRNYLMMVALRF